MMEVFVLANNRTDVRLRIEFKQVVFLGGATFVWVSSCVPDTGRHCDETLEFKDNGLIEVLAEDGSSD